MFAIFNIDVADKNPKYKNKESDDSDNSEQSNSENKQDDFDDEEDNGFTGDTDAEQNDNPDFGPKSESESEQEDTTNVATSYFPESTYKPKQNIRKRLEFTIEDGQVIDKLKGTNDLGNKIYNLVFELSKLDLQVHRYSTAYLYRALPESSTKYLSQRQVKVNFVEKALENSILNALNYFGDISKKGTPLSQKTIKAWRDTVKDRKLIDTLNEYIHNELPVDAYLLQETWNTMKGYVIACLTIS